MKEPTIIPSRGLKCLSAVARWMLWLTLAFWCLFALAWAGLHGWIVPRIAEYRPLLETQASRALGIPVRIGHIRAWTVGLIPSFEFEDVVLLDPSGRQALRLPRVMAALSPISVWNRGFEQLYIERPELEVRRTAEGRWLIAGLPFTRTDTDDGRAADWVFSQRELVISKGVVHWTDDLRQAPTLSLNDVDLLLRNSPRRHAVRLDATPPADWGDRFSLMGRFRQPLLSTHSGHWQAWTGQTYALFGRVDVAQLRRHLDLDLGVDVAQGQGALRLWVDIQRGEFAGATADVALAQVNARLAPGLEPLAMTSVQGRLGGRLLPGGFEFSTTGLQFLTADGLRWPGGNVHVSFTQPDPRLPGKGEFRADRMDLTALRQIAHRVPLGQVTHAALQRHAPAGLVESLQANWQGPVSGPEHYAAKGRVVGLTLASQASVPGVRGLDVDFDLTQAGGKAQLSMQDGVLDLPAVFDEAELPLRQFQAEARWQIDPERIAVQIPSLRFANADARGEAQLSWHTADPAKSSSHSRFPGVLDLTAHLGDVDGTRVHRYLPKVLPADVRKYVREAVTAGRVPGADFRIKGDLHDLPYGNGRQGEFRIAAQVKDVVFDYVPRFLQPAQAAPWPGLAELSGDLIFERQSMFVRRAAARFAAHPDLQVTKVEAAIPDLMHTVVGVEASVRGPLTDALSLVARSPLQNLTGHALADATASGGADYKLKLALPIAQLDRSKVQGSVVLAGNEIKLAPQSPTLSRVRGAVNFNESGFVLSGVQARALGGETRLEGGMRPVSAGSPSDAPVTVRAAGVATAEGLRQAKELGLVSTLAENASGSAPYVVTLAFRSGVPDIVVTSPLQGLAIDLPAPLGKTAETSLPLRFENLVLKDSGGGRDQLALEVGGVASVMYVRDTSGPAARVLSGVIGVGGAPLELPPWPDSGVRASVRVGRLDADAWENILTRAGAASRGAAHRPASTSEALVQSYLPTVLSLQAQELVVDGRTLNKVVAGGSREGSVWRATLDAAELNGYLEYRPPQGEGAGRLFARLAHLRLAQTTESDVEALLDEQPASIPALDIVVDDFELRGRRLGRLEVEAVNRGADTPQREWRLNKFNVLMPEARLTATGNWSRVQAPSALAHSARAIARDGRRTVMNFKLDIQDSGELLKRFGMPGVVRQGKGRLEGQVAWLGSPLTPDYPSLAGQINLNVESGQFLKADPGLAKLLGVLSLQSLPRRLTLDFRDVFSEGFAFDFVRGDAQIEQGIATTNNLQMKGVNAAVLMDGRADVARETQDLKVVIVPEINAGTASLVATAIHPAIGLGTFLAQWLLRRPLSEATTQEFHIDGSWADPRIVKVPPRLRSADASVSEDKP